VSRAELLVRKVSELVGPVVAEVAVEVALGDEVERLLEDCTSCSTLGTGV